LEKIPSPYTTGIFDHLMPLPYRWNASQETHRGCPYRCTFCDWGSAIFTKVRAFEDERLEAEFEWFGQSGIQYVFNCDANYRLLTRAIALTEKLVATKQKYGFPQQFRATYAKNSNMKIFQLAKLLNDNGLNKGVTLSMQSMDLHTLDVIKRNNIKVTDLEQLLRLYHSENIITYTELIMALPGETYGSFVAGVDELLRVGQHDALNIYLCGLLPNSEMSDAGYIKAHGIEALNVPILLQHSTPFSDPIREREDIVVGTTTMPREDWKRTYLFSWAVQSMHSLCLTQYLAVLLYHEFTVSYGTFYEKLLGFASANPHTLVGREFAFVSSLVDSVLQGGSWDVVIPKFGDVVWPAEEASFLNLVCDKDRFYQEMARFVEQLKDELELDIDKGLMYDLINYQQHMVVDPYSGKRFTFELEHNLHEYFRNALLGDRIPLTLGHHVLAVNSDADYKGDLPSYAQQVVWYGRKGGSFRHTNVVESTYE
jgi:hypothetical protein